jgi:hypothetical protein
MKHQQLNPTLLNELPNLLLHDKTFRKEVIRIARKRFADKTTTEDRFDQMMQLLKQKIAEDRQMWAENQQRWEENRQLWAESQQRWEENDRRWAENQQQLDALKADIQRLDRKFDQTISALGTRWGLHSEATFRNALAGIFKDFAGVEVMRVLEYDDVGFVFGRPDQIDLDLIIKDGLLIIAELKASVTKSDVHIFDRKVQFYENKHSRQATRKLIISPMVDQYTLPLANRLGIEVYSYVDNVRL